MRSSELCRDGDLAIRLLRNERPDLELMVRWLAEPAVHEWWDPDEPAPSIAQVAERYGPLAESGSTTTGCIIELAKRPIGYIQFYRWSSEPDGAAAMELPTGSGSFGLDVLIGEPDLLGAGHGSRAVALLCAHLARDRGATDVVLTTEVINARAQRAYEKAGFTRIKQTWDLDTRDGERVHSWVMRWVSPTPT